MLVRQRDLDSKLTTSPSLRAPDFAWFGPLYDQISTRFIARAGTPEGFPCVFAQNAFRRSNIRFALVPLRRAGDPTSYDFSVLAKDLAAYLDESKDWDGDVNTTEPLLAVFEPLETNLTTVGYQRVFDGAMQHLVDNDPSPWPEHTHTDPGSPYWSMCFRDTQVFVNVSHPAHVNRRSRNLCDSLVLVINPRERFDRVAGDNPKGERIRRQIRSNIEIYDGIRHSPLLDHYLSGGLEWPQYMLPDTNEAGARRCPLQFGRNSARRAAVDRRPAPLRWIANGISAARANIG